METSKATRLNNENQLVDHLFRHESGKMVAVLTKLFGFDELEIAEDIVQDTFILAFEHWKIHGSPENPTAWLYQVAKNKSLDFIRRRKKFQDVATEVNRVIPMEYSATANLELAFQKITDNQLQMLFAVCHPSIPIESQVALALKTLCGFSLEEIAQSFLANKETVKKRLQRAKEKIRAEKIILEFPEKTNLNLRLDGVLETIYLLFNEGYYSSSVELVLRKDLCLEAMRLCLLLIENNETDVPKVNALLSLMCFHSSRFDSRIGDSGELISLDKQDQSKWNKELIERGKFYLNRAAAGEELTSYHLEAMIAFHHTQPVTAEKWRQLHLLYDQLLEINPSPMIALNRAFVVSKSVSIEQGIKDALRIEGLEESHLYFALLGELYANFDVEKSRQYWEKSKTLAQLQAQKKMIDEKMRKSDGSVREA